MTAVEAPPAGGRTRHGQGLLRNPPAVCDATRLVSGSTPLGQLESLLREHGPLALDGLAALAGMEPAVVVQLLDRHPLIFGDGNGKRGILEKMPRDFAAVAFPDEWKVATPNGEHAAVTRSDYGPAVTLSRGPLSPRDMAQFAPYWLSRFSDAEIALMAGAMFGVSSPENVHAWRERLDPRSEGRANGSAVQSEAVAAALAASEREAKARRRARIRAS